MPGVPFEELTLRASEAATAGRLLEALRFARAGVALNPMWSQGWFYVGMIGHLQGRFVEARDAFRKVVEIAPEWAAAWALLGLCEFQLEEYDRALDDIRRGQSLGLSGDEEIERAAFLHEALLLIRMGEFERSVAPLTELVRTQPDSAGLRAACGLMVLRIAALPTEVAPDQRDLVMTAGAAGCSVLAGRPEEAEEGFEKLVARYPSARGVHGAYGLFLSGEASERALPMLRKEVELYPDNARAHLQIALEELTRGQAAAALPSAREAARLAPELFATNLALGRALAETGAVEEGIAELEQAAVLGPERAEVYLALARAYAAAGRFRDVERAREKLLELEARRRPQLR